VQGLVESAATTLQPGLGENGLGLHSASWIVSNVTTSLTEDALAAGGLWALFTHPLRFLSGLAIFMLLALWLLVCLWRLVAGMFGRADGHAG